MIIRLYEKRTYPKYIRNIKNDAMFSRKPNTLAVSPAFAVEF